MRIRRRAAPEWVPPSAVSVPLSGCPARGTARCPRPPGSACGSDRPPDRGEPRAPQGGHRHLPGISHDLSVASGRAEWAAVMYAGRIVETRPTASIFSRPQHRCTEALLGAAGSLTTSRHSRLHVIPGGVPSPYAPPVGCRFAARCAQTPRPARTSPRAAVAGSLDDGHAHSCRHPASAAVAQEAVATIQERSEPPRPTAAPLTCTPRTSTPHPKTYSARCSLSVEDLRVELMSEIRHDGDVMTSDAASTTPTT